MTCPLCRSEASIYHFANGIDIRCWKCGHGVYGMPDEKTALRAFETAAERELLAHAQTRHADEPGEGLFE